MSIQTLVEPTAEGKFRATCGAPFDLSAEGATVDEAVGLLRGQIEARISRGAQIIEIHTSKEENPWLKFAGSFRDNPLFGEWQEVIAENRRKADQDPDRP